MSCLGIFIESMILQRRSCTARFLFLEAFGAWILPQACHATCKSSLMLAQARLASCAVNVDWAVNEDFPIFKKYGVMNSGLLDSTRYNKTIFDSLAVVKVSSPPFESTKGLLSCLIEGIAGLHESLSNQ